VKFLCWLLTGHRNAVIRTELEPDGRGGRYLRVWTKCEDCGRESDGWSYGESYVGPRP